jgi:hypothetical protein
MWNNNFKKERIRNLFIKIIFGLIFLGFIYSNYNYLKYKSRSAKIEKKLSELQKRFFGNIDNNEVLNPDLFRYNKITFANKYSHHIKIWPSLILVFDDKGCLPCIKYEIEMINELYEKFPNRIIVFYSGVSKKFLETFSPKFPYITLNPEDNLFSKEITFNKPFALFISKDNEIYDIHKAEVGVFLKSNIFYSRITKLFELIHK